MTPLRELYVRHLRDTAVAGAARAVWYWRWPAGWRRDAAMPRLARAVTAARRYWYRASYVRRYYWQRIRPAFGWLVHSRESENFTYDLTPRNRDHLAEFLAVGLRRPSSEIAGYIAEILADTALKTTVADRVRALGPGSGIDETARFGRRVGWYAAVRALKPRVVVETGVDKGLGATVLCAALLRNAQAGHSGRYYGTDINPGAGAIFAEPYRSTGTILCGDSIESLSALNATIDLFINDSDHSAEYEGREYRVVAPKLSEHAVIIGDNAHVTDELLRFSHATGRQFLFFREEPADHWYLGASIGLSFK